MAASTLTGRSADLLAAEVVLRVAAVLAAAAALWLLVGYNGLGLLGAIGKPGATPDAISVMNERTVLSGPASDASTTAANEILGPLEERSEAYIRSGATGQPLWAEVYGPAEVSVGFWGASLAQRWAWVLVRAVPAAAAAAGLWLLAGLARSARQGDPFTRTNVRRLVAITALVGVAGVVGDWGSTFVRRWLLDSSDLAGQTRMDFSLSFGFIAVVLVLGVITEVWRRGVAMREDLDGLV